MDQFKLYQPRPLEQHQGFILVIEVPGIEGERLLRRISFLRSRANAHLEVERENRHSRACAATLLRDAACIELLMGRMREACEDLLLAGKELLEVDLVEGAALVALADSVSPQEILGRFSNLIERVRNQEVRASASDVQDDDRPMHSCNRICSWSRTRCRNNLLLHRQCVWCSNAAGVTR